jgi:AcrR family transcriptional regulator
VTKRAYHHGDLKAALVKATLRAIAEDGPDGFTLRDVARRAGVSPAAPYRHFRNKDELLAEVAFECSERLAQTVLAAIAEVPPGDALEQFRRTGIAYVLFAWRHPEHFRAMSIPNLFDKMSPEHRAGVEGFHAEQRAALAAAQVAGTIAPIPLDEMVLAANSLVHGLAHLIISGQLGEVDEPRVIALATAVTRAIGVGFVSRTAPLPPDKRGR